MSAIEVDRPHIFDTAPTTYTYRRGCRCDECREARRVYDSGRAEVAGKTRRDHTPFAPKAATEDWKADAACRNTEPDLFFGERGSNVAIIEAKTLCTRCTVRRDCLTYALTTPRELAGVWGGLAPQERRSLTLANITGRPLPPVHIPTFGRPARSAS